LLLAIPLVLSAFTSLWNPLGFPSLHIDEGHYMRKALSILEGTGIDPLARYAAPYFGQIFLAGALGIVGYPDSLNLSDTGGGDNVLHSVETLYLFPRVLMGLLAVADTFLIYKITERRYHNRNVALIAAILFAVMPYGWLFRRIFLETIQVPFLLTSILLAVYIKDLKIEKNKNNSNNKTLRYKTIPMILLSGAFLGLSIFTKVPVFAMIPVVGFLIYTNTNNNTNNNTNGRRLIRLRNLGLWFIPVILIPLIWPAHAMIIGEFDQWKHGVLWQTTERPSRPLIGTMKTFFEMDPVLFVLSIAGLIYAAVKRDFFLLLWVIPFLIFLYAIDYVSSFHLMPLIPAFCIAASRFLVEIIDKTKIIIKKTKLQQILPFAIISGIIIFGLVSTTMLITTNVNSTVYKTLAVIIQKLPNKDDTNNTGPVTLVAAPTYFWLPRYAFDKDFVDKGYYSGSPIKTQKYIVVADRGYMASKSGSAISTEDINPTRPPNHRLQDLLDNSHTIDTFLPDDTAKYNVKSYPYLNMRQTPESREITIKSNY
jgi:Dolichyl-phosphate-mannose-protein mannosyltransferase